MIFFLIFANLGVSAHPLGNFTTNHFTRIEVGAEQVRVRFVVDMAEIPAFQELQAMGVASGEGPSRAALDAYLERVVPQYAENLFITVDGERVRLESGARAISLPPGEGGLPTLRLECDLTGAVPSANSLGVAAERRLRFEDAVHRGRLGWREVVIVPASGISVYNSSAFGNAITDELKAYPEDMLTAPLDERMAELSFTRGVVPVGATTLRTRDGRTLVVGARDPLAALIDVPEVTFGVAFFGLLAAAAFGAIHAFSPGHGKTVVGAYLVGSRGTPRHALFLGLTVTITHTAGVVALGLVTLFASQYVLPERLFPILSFLSGAIVVAIGLSLFANRLRGALGVSAGHGHAHDHSHDHHTHDHAHHHHHDEAHDHSHHAHDHTHSHSHSHDHSHDHGHDHNQAHSHSHGDHTHHHDHTHDHHDHSHHTHVHSHGGRPHSHLPPEQVTWRSLLALGVSGGLLPCPSALVLLLAAISLQRVGYGLALVVAFSVGLAATLTAIGLAFLYAGRFLNLSPGASRNPFVRALPVVSAFVIACVGVVICYQTLAAAGFDLFATVTAASSGGAEAAEHDVDLASMGAMAVLGLGLVFGLKHATEVDHVVAVTTIVSEHRNIFRAALVGGLWGIGHTLSLVVVGAIVLALRIAIPESVAGWLEFGVALMIIGLGASALARALRARKDAHVHTHTHDGVTHSHIHFHEHDAVHEAESAVEHDAPNLSHSHALRRIGIKPLIVGAVHGLAGSAALTLLVLTQINSALLGMIYLAVFGIGSIVGMLLMSGLVGLPFVFSARKLTSLNYGLQTLAGLLSIAFGLWYAYETGIANGLLR